MKKQKMHFCCRALISLLLAVVLLADGYLPGLIPSAYALGDESGTKSSSMTLDQEVTAFAQELFFNLSEGATWDSFQYLDRENLTFMNFIDRVYGGDYKKDNFFKRVVEWALDNTSGDGVFLTSNPDREIEEIEMYINLLQTIAESENAGLQDVSDQAKAEAQKTKGILGKSWNLAISIFDFVRRMNPDNKEDFGVYQPLIDLVLRLMAAGMGEESALRLLRVIQTIFSRNRQFQQVSSSLSLFRGILSRSDDENLTSALDAMTTVYSRWEKELEKTGTGDFVWDDEAAEEQFLEKKRTAIRNMLDDYLAQYYYDPDRISGKAVRIAAGLCAPRFYIASSITTAAADMLLNTNSFFQAFHQIRCMYNIASAMAEMTRASLPAAGADWRDYMAYAENYMLYLKVCAMGNAYLYGMMNQKNFIGWDDATDILMSVVGAIKKTFFIPGLAAKAAAAGIELGTQLAEKEKKDQEQAAGYEEWYRLQMELLGYAYDNAQSYIARIMGYYYEAVSGTEDMKALAGRNDLHKRTVRGTLTQDEFYAQRTDLNKPNLDKPNEEKGAAASGVSVQLVGKATGKVYGSTITDENGYYELHYMHEAVRNDPLKLVIAEKCEDVIFAPKHVDIWRDAELRYRSGWKSALADAAGYDETTLSWLFEYCDQLFLQPSSVFSQELARLSLGMALAGYSAVEADPEWETDGPAGREANIADAYARLNFTGAEYHNYDIGLNNDDGKVAFSLASRDIVNPEISVLEDPEQKEHLMVAVLRGGGYGAEWVNNFMVGGGDGVDANLHSGFGSAAMKVKAAIEEYRNSRFSDGRPVRLWIAGYSRSAAVSNLVAGALSGSDLFDAVYAYLYATPSGTQAPVNAPGVFNIVYEGDLIPRAAFAFWGFGKNGETLYFGPGASEVGDQEYSRIASEFRQITRYSGARYDPRDYYASSYVMNDLTAMIGKYVRDENDYVSKLQPYVLALTRLIFTNTAASAEDMKEEKAKNVSFTARLVRQDIGKGNRILEERIARVIPDYGSEAAALKDSLIRHGVKAGIKAALKTMNQDMLYYTLRLIDLTDLPDVLDVIEWFVNDGENREEKAAAKEEFYEYCLGVIHVITAGQLGDYNKALGNLRRKAEFNQLMLGIADRVNQALAPVPVVGRLIGKAGMLAEKTRELSEAVIPVLGLLVLLLEEIGESTLFETNTTVGAIAAGHTPETYLSWLMALDSEQMFGREDRMNFSLPLMPWDIQKHGDVSLRNSERIPYSGLLPQKVMFFGNKEKDRLFLQYDESGTDLLIAVPGNAAEEAGPVISDQLQEEWKEKYPHVSAEHIPELADGYYNYSESIRLGYKDFYADSRNVMWIEGLDEKLVLAVFERYDIYMGVGLEPTGYWFYIVPQDGTEMERFRPDISLTVPPGAYTGDMAYDHTTVSTTEVSRMNVEYDQKSGLWCFAIYQWGYHRVNPNDKGGRMIGGYAESGDEWRLVRNLFTVFNGKLIPVARYFLGREFERNGIRKDGAVSPGWFLEDGHLCFRREDGTKAVGWMMEDGDWYYFDAEGAMKTGWIDDGGKKYYLDRNGVMVTGSVQVDGVLQVFGEDGAWQGER